LIALDSLDLEQFCEIEDSAYSESRKRCMVVSGKGVLNGS